MKTNLLPSLIPVIELQPRNFSTVERPSPNESFAAAPQEWLAFNRSCYQDAGLDQIKPISPLSWLFELNQLSEPELKIILKTIFAEAAQGFDAIDEIFNDPIEYAPLIPGGYLLMIDGEIKSEPGCCCGLENIIDWKEAATVMTGHGDDDLVWINRSDIEAVITVKRETFSIPKKQFDQMIITAESSIDQFISTSGKLLRELYGIDNGHSLAQAMIYKWD